MPYFINNLIEFFWKILKEDHLKVEDVEEEEEEVEETLKEKVMSSQSTIL